MTLGVEIATLVIDCVGRGDEGGHPAHLDNGLIVMLDPAGHPFSVCTR